MSDINRKPDAQSVHHVHSHFCPNCQRTYSCNCAAQPELAKLTCIDCEKGLYDPRIHGGLGTKAQA